MADASKTVNGESLSKSAFAYTPSDEPSTWKLRIDDAQHVGGAAAALSSGGYRGQEADIPDADRPAVVAKVRAAWKKFHPDASTDELPAALKASEQGDVSALQRAIDAVNAFIQSEAAELESEPDDADDLRDALYIRDGLLQLQSGEAQEYEEPAAGDLSVPTLVGAAKPTKRLNHYARKLKELLRTKVQPSDFDAAHRTALGYAGGMSRTHAEPYEPKTFSETGARAVSFMQPPEWMPFMPVPHTSQHPEYGEVTLTRERNANFVKNFQNHVYQDELPIDAEHDLKGGGAFGFITDLRQNADGSVDARTRWTDRGTTALTGDRFISISPEWFDEWVDKVTGQKYQDVAIGAALTNRPFFKPKTLRSLTASEHVIGTRFGPPAKQEAQHMADEPIGLTHGAMDTTHSHEHAANGFGGEDTHTHDHSHDGDGDHGHAHAGMQMRERQHMTTEQARTFEEQLAERDAQIAALRQASESMAEQAKQAKEAVERMQADAQTKRFTDEIMGRSDANSLRWVLGATTQTGEDGKSAVERQVGVLRSLAQTFGEESAEFHAYVAQQRSMAETVRHSAVFTQHGLPGQGEPSSAEQRLQAFAEEYRSADRSLTHDQAMVRAMHEHPDLYEQSEREHERRIRAAE